MQDTTLLDQLTDDIGIAGQLLELTDQEFTALSERDLAGLESILAKKQPLLALLGQHSTQRSQWLIGQQLSADRASNRPSFSKPLSKPAAARMSATAASSAPTRAP
jgi:flagellar biosynthesis protein FlgN